MLSVPSQCNIYLGEVSCISDLSCRVRHTKMQKEMWWEASRWKYPKHLNWCWLVWNTSLSPISRWWNLCVQTQPWCWERPWLVSARTWTWPATGGNHLEACDLGVPGCLLVSVQALPLSTSRQWFPFGCSPPASSPATPILWRLLEASVFTCQAIAPSHSQPKSCILMAAKWEGPNSMHGSRWAAYGGRSSSRSCQYHTWTGLSKFKDWIIVTLTIEVTNILTSTARLCELHLRPPGHPRHQLRWRGSCREAHLQQGVCKWKEGPGSAENVKLSWDWSTRPLVQHGGKESWSDHAGRQQGILCQPGARARENRLVSDLVKIFLAQFVLLQLVGAAFGAAGQRCMALTTAVMVWIIVIVIIIILLHLGSHTRTLLISDPTSSSWPSRLNTSWAASCSLLDPMFSSWTGWRGKWSPAWYCRQGS